MYITRLASNETFSLSNKIHREVGQAKGLSAPRYTYISQSYLLCQFEQFVFATLVHWSMHQVIQKCFYLQNPLKQLKI